jgi:hypothetical protein
VSTKSLLELAVKRYDLQNVEFSAFGSVRRGGSIPPVWNVPLVVFRGFQVHRVLIVIVPEHLGLFSTAVLRGRGRPGGVESFARGSRTKVAALVPLSELSILKAMRVVGVAAGTPTSGSVVCLRHASGVELTLNSFSTALVGRLHQLLRT